MNQKNKKNKVIYKINPDKNKSHLTFVCIFICILKSLEQFLANLA